MTSKKEIPNFDMVEDPYVYRSIKVFGKTLIYATSKNILKIIPEMQFAILKL